jgi:surfactin synthase thioesterase subunit
MSGAAGLHTHLRISREGHCMGSALRAFEILLRLNLSGLAHKLLASSSAALSWSGKGRLWLVE